MDKLVFLDPDDINETPFTTSKLIAEHGKVKHKNTVELIRNYEEDLKEFGKVTFETEASQSGQKEIVYHLNEQQATLLITFMKNTMTVIKFKKALVKQFYIMQKELTKRITTREIGKRAREALTNAIQSLPESPHKCYKYNQYTDLVYKIVFGKIARKLREEYGITKKDNLRDRFSAEENGKIDKLEQMIGSMIELGYDYGVIKDALTKKYLMSA
jgi:phage regulator Rha-like protein